MHCQLHGYACIYMAVYMRAWSTKVHNNIIILVAGESIHKLSCAHHAAAGRRSAVNHLINLISEFVEFLAHACIFVILKFKCDLNNTQSHSCNYNKGNRPRTSAMQAACIILYWQLIVDLAYMIIHGCQILHLQSLHYAGACMHVRCMTIFVMKFRHAYKFLYVLLI